MNEGETELSNNNNDNNNNDNLYPNEDIMYNYNDFFNNYHHHHDHNHHHHQNRNPNQHHQGGSVVQAFISHWLGPGSSPVDWCEDNYTVSPHIAEFVNTFSNFLFILVPLFAMHLWSSYASQVSKGVYAVWLLFTFVGVSSAYFHATLSLLGQLLDELSILWVLMLSYTLFTPSNYWAPYARSRFSIYAGFMAVLAFVITVSAFLYPAVNAYALFLVGAPAVTMLVTEIKAVRDPKVAGLGARTLLALILAAVAWISDRFLCWVWKAVKLPILHALWHVLIFVTAYGMQVLFCYFHASQDVPESRPILRFWPRRALSWGLPYVYCLSAGLDKTP